MARQKVAAIDPDAIRDKPLAEVSAADFLSALTAGGLAPGVLAVWPEKKKVELWLEPENLGGFRVGNLIDVIRNEKKKRELEPGPFLDRGELMTGGRLDEILSRLGRLEARLGL